MNSKVGKRLLGVMVMTTILMAGCSMEGSDEGHSLDRRSGPEVETEIGARSSEVMDIMATKGKVTEPGPHPFKCADASQDGHVIRHAWSLYGVSNDSLGIAMKNLLVGLPKKGWKIVENGDDGSRNKNQQVLAVHLDTRTQMDVRWKKALDTNRPMITVSIYSRCFLDTNR